MPDQQGAAARGDRAPILNGRRPRIRAHSVCVECKRRGNVCVMVAHGTPCLGPVTHAGCGAICPSYNRGCYGCYGPMETPNTASLDAWSGLRRIDLVRVYRSYNAAREPFREASEAHEQLTRRTIRTDYLARVEGEGAMYVQLEGERGARRQAADLRATAVLRGVPARPRVHRGARHHLSNLRDLPDRLPDERAAGDRGRVRGRDRRGPDPGPAAADLLRRVDREPSRCTCTCCTRRTSSATRGSSRWRRTIRSSPSRACS